MYIFKHFAKNKKLFFCQYLSKFEKLKPPIVKLQFLYVEGIIELLNSNSGRKQSLSASKVLVHGHV
jgi:hypothetical protein